MYCRDCGEKLTLRFLENEGLVPYCSGCGNYKFPLFPVAVCMTVTNRTEDKILLAKHKGDDDYTLFAGYVKKGENAEKTIPRELREETKLTPIKWRYYASRYHESKDVLMLNFIVTTDETDPTLNEEIEEAHWYTFDEAKEMIRKNSSAEAFLLGAINDLSRKKK